MSLLPVETALARVLEGARPLAMETVPLAEAHGRVLAKALSAKRNQPPFPASAMDGYAVKAADAAASGARLKVIGEAAAGRRFGKTVKSGQAVRIFTGAPLPKGTDSILIQENAAREGELLITREPVRPGQHVRAAGADFRQGDVLLADGRCLTARDIAITASLNFASVPVRRRPKVVIIATGDELVAPGSKPTADQIISSNNFGLAAFARHFGAEVVDLGIIGDSLPKIRRAIRKALSLSADIVVTTGGASVGDHDLIAPALQAESIALDFWKVALRPGKPLMFARKGATRFIGLPGNPVSCFVCARIFITPLISRLLGRDDTDIPVMARLTAPMRTNDQRQEYARGLLERQSDGTFTVKPFASQDSSMMSLLAQSNGFIIRPPHAPGAPAGSLVPVLPVDF